jgi:hypothetical protein
MRIRGNPNKQAWTESAKLEESEVNGRKTLKETEGEKGLYKR